MDSNGFYRRINDVAIYDGAVASMDTYYGRWQITCQLHGTIRSCQTRRQAVEAAQAPAQWCTGCFIESHKGELSLQ